MQMMSNVSDYEDAYTSDTLVSQLLGKPTLSNGW
jgi:hypothetical protein